MSTTQLFADRDWPLVFAFANQKGGVGKTTLAIQFALYCSSVLGKKVLCIDFDQQGDFTKALADSDENGAPILGQAMTLELFNPDCEQVEPVKTSKGVDLIGTPRRDLRLAEVSKMNLNDIYYAQTRISEVFERYDVVVVDCPPAAGNLVMAALFMAHYVISPIGFGGFGIEGISDMRNLADMTRLVIEKITEEHQDYPKFLGAVVNSAVEVSEAKNYVSEIYKQFPEIIFKNVIGYRKGLKNASYHGDAIWTERYQVIAKNEIIQFNLEVLERAETNEKALQ
mgnify:FL=1